MFSSSSGGLCASIYFWVTLPLVASAVIGILTFLVPYLLQAFVFNAHRDIKKRYPNAKWAIVTGGSSGIGRAIVNRLASNGINVVILAINDGLFQDAKKQLPLKNPQVRFKFFEEDLGDVDNLKQLATNLSGRLQDEGIERVHMLFSNAGYMKTGFYKNASREATMANFHCNTTAAVELSHWFLNQAGFEEGERRLLCITSSPAGYLPTPFTVLYGASKCFLSNFAAALAVEAHPRGVDVVAMHPNPTRTNFFNEGKESGTIQFFKSIAGGPELIADEIWKAAGRYTWVDHGSFSLTSRLGLKVLDTTTLVEIMKRIVTHMGEYRIYMAQEKPTAKEE